MLDSGHHLYLDVSAHVALGVGVLIYARWNRYVRKVHRINDRVIGVDLHFDQVRICYIAIYLPHAGYSLETLDHSYAELCELVSDVDK